MSEEKSMARTISIYNCSAVMYHGTAPVAAVAGDSMSIEKFIEEQSNEFGPMRVYGEHRLIDMRKKEQADEAD